MTRSAKLALVLLLSASALAWAVACGKSARPPEPPRLRTEMVRELLVALAQRDYDRAAPKAARLRELSPGNVYLAELEQTIRNNRVIRQLQAHLDADDMEAALALATEAVRTHGRHEDLLAVETSMNRLAEVQALVKTCVAPPDAVPLARAAARLKTLAENEAPLAPFLADADARLSRAREMLAWERRRAVDSLCSDLDRMVSEHDRDAYVLLALLAVADPEHPALAAWRDFLAGKMPHPPLTYAPTKKPAP